MKILHLVPTLQVGGAERFIERLAPALAARHAADQRVIGLAGDGPAGTALRKAGISATGISNGGMGLASAVLETRQIVRSWRPDIVQSWLYLADLTGAMATFGRPDTRLIWNLRCSDAWLNHKTRTIRAACRMVARHAPDAIVACGARAASFHATLGYPANAITVIPNGYRFPALADVRAKWERRRLTRPNDTMTIGAAGRYDRAKGYHYLIGAVAILRQRGFNIRLALAGRGCSIENGALIGEIEQHDLTGLVDLYGELDDLAPFLTELDVFCLSSVSEGFPNVLCEAIAAGVPAIATDVGDASQIVAPAKTVPPGSAIALADRLAELLGTPEAERGAEAIRAAIRVRDAYGLDRIADRYNQLYQSILDCPNAE